MKLKKVLATVLTGVMVVGSLPMLGKGTQVEAAGVTSLSDVDCTKGWAEERLEPLEITEAGFKLSFKSTTASTATEAWNAPSYDICTVDSKSEIPTNGAIDQSIWAFTGRSDNYATDKNGNRWGPGGDEDTGYLTASNSYVFVGVDFDKSDEKTAFITANKAGADCSIEAYLVGTSVVVEYKNGNTFSASRVAVDPDKKIYLSLTGDVCKMTDMKLESGANKNSQIKGVTCSAYHTIFSDAINVKDGKTILSFTSTTDEGMTENYKTPIICVYNDTKELAVIRSDCAHLDGADTNKEIVGTMRPSYGGSWPAWVARNKKGTGCFVTACIEGENLILTVGNSVFGSVTTIPVDTTKTVSLKVSGENCKTSNIDVSYISDNYYNIASYRADDTYTYPTKDGKIFAGWYEDADYTTPIDKNVKAGTAYAKFVDEELLTVKCQLAAGTTAESESTKMRIMLGVDSLNYESVGFKVTYGTKEEKDLNATTVYSGIKVTQDGDTKTEIPSQHFGDTAKYMLPYVLSGITNANFSTEIKVVPYWVTEDGTTVSGEERTLTVSEKL